MLKKGLARICFLRVHVQTIAIFYHEISVMTVRNVLISKSYNYLQTL